MLKYGSARTKTIHINFDLLLDVGLVDKILLISKNIHLNYDDYSHYHERSLVAKYLKDLNKK